MTETLPIIVLLIFKVAISASNYCPNNCYCKENGKFVSCKNKKLEFVPPKIPLNVEVLDLSGNNFNSLLPNSFVNLTHLQKLILEGCQIETIFVDNFNGLINLKHLCLSSNRISTIPSDTFRNLTQLKHINFGSNKFINIPNIISLGLTRLNMHNNQISNVKIGKLFLFNKKLRRLIMSDNKVQYLNEGDFENLRYIGIQSLILTKNILHYIHPQIFEPLKTFLQTLKIDGNPSLTSVPLEESLKVFRGSSQLLYLDLKTTGIVSIDNDFFRPLTFSHLNFIDLSVNSKLTFIDEDSFKGLKYVQILNLDKCNISSTNIKFYYLVLLKEIHLSHNRFSQCPNRLPSSLEVIDLSHNFIETILEADFKKFRFLKTLNLDNNFIKTIEEGSFSNLVQMTSLHLQFNQLRKVQYSNNFNKSLLSRKEIFADCSSMLFLDLSHNKISGWSSDSFLGISSTVIDIDLSYNRLRYISVVSNDNNYLPISFKKLQRVSLEYNHWNCICNNVQWLLLNKVILGNIDAMTCEYPFENKGQLIFDVIKLKNCSTNHVPFSQDIRKIAIVCGLILIALLVIVILAFCICNRRRVINKMRKIIRSCRQGRYHPLNNDNESSWIKNVKAADHEWVEAITLVTLKRETSFGKLKLHLIDNLKSPLNQIAAYHCSILVIDYPPVDENILIDIVKERLKFVQNQDHYKVTYLFYCEDEPFDDECCHLCTLLCHNNVKAYTDIGNALYALF